MYTWYFQKNTFICKSLFSSVNESTKVSKCILSSNVTWKSKSNVNTIIVWLVDILLLKISNFLLNFPLISEGLYQFVFPLLIRRCPIWEAFLLFILMCSLMKALKTSAIFILKRTLPLNSRITSYHYLIPIHCEELWHFW